MPPEGVNGYEDEIATYEEAEIDFPKLYLDFVDSMTTSLGADMVVELSYRYLQFSDLRRHIDSVEQIQMN